MTAIWPSTIPQRPLRSGATGGLPNTLLRTQMEAGVAKVRRKYTAGPEVMALTWRMSWSQWSTLRSFIEQTIAGGAQVFTLPHHPITDQPVTVRLVPVDERQLVQWRSVDRVPGMVEVATQLEVLP